jgi:hypothetical protein
MERLAVSTFGPPILVAQGTLRNRIEFVSSRAPYKMPKSLPGRSRKYYRASPGGFDGEQFIAVLVYKAYNSSPRL